MRRTLGILTLAVGIGAAGLAAAQFRDRDREGRQEPNFVERPQITLFERPGFQGRSRSYSDDVGNLSDTGFNDHASSVRVRGRWKVCADSDVRGRCEDVTQDIADLKAIHFDHQISSLAYIGRRPAPPPPVIIAPPPPREVPTRDALQGATVGLFLQPSFEGGPLPSRQEAADRFCRARGYRVALYADYSGLELRDLVCTR